MEWFRFYDSVLHKRKVQQLPGDFFKGWINLLCLANEGNGVLPPLADIAYELRLSESDTELLLKRLIQDRLIDEHDGYLEMHDWAEFQKDSDKVSDRVKRFRERQRIKVIAQATGENGAKQDVTLHETLPKRYCNPLEEIRTEENREEEIDKSISVEQAPQERASLPEKSKQQTISAAQQRIQESVQEIAPRIKARHPEIRNGMSAHAIQNKLYAILKRHRIKASDAPEFLSALDGRHERWCQFPQWQDKDGIYAKALANWLSPREDRYLEEPPTVSAPANGKAPEKQATRFNREIYGEFTGEDLSPERISELQDQARNDPSPAIRQAAIARLSEYQIPEVSPWKN